MNSDIQTTRKPINFDAIPQQLKDIDRWVMWKGNKIPYCAKHKKAASSTDPETWESFTSVKIWYETGDYSGVGFVLSDDDDILCIDLDNKEGDPAKLEEYKQFAQTFDTYAEISPSGNGIHIWGLGKKPGNKCRRGDAELYGRLRYMTVTGDQIEGTKNTLENCQESIDELYSQIEDHEVELREQIGSASSPDKRPPRPVPAPALTDQEIIDIGCTEETGKFLSLYNGSTAGYPSRSEADSAMCFKIAFYTKDFSQIDRIFRRSALYREKWDREDIRDRTINNALLCVNEQYHPKKNPVQKQVFRPDPVPDIDPEYYTDIENSFRDGIYLSEQLEAYANVHSGHTEVMEAISDQFVCGFILNSHGINLQLNGTAGKGKSSSSKQGYKLHPETAVLSADMSPKARWYIPDEYYHAGLILNLDDKEMVGGEQDDFKRMTTDFQGGTKRLVALPTGGKIEGTMQQLPQRTSMTITCVEPSGNEQAADRFYHVYVADDPKTLEARDLFIKRRMTTGALETPITPIAQRCIKRAQYISERLFVVYIPFAVDELIMTPGLDTRYINLYQDFVMTNAVRNFQDRDPEYKSDVIYISARIADHHHAVKMMAREKMFRDSCFTPDEQKLVDFLRNHDRAMDRRIGISMPEIKREYKPNGRTINPRPLMVGRKEDKYGSASDPYGGIVLKAGIDYERAPSNDPDRHGGSIYFKCYTLKSGCGVATLDTRFSDFTLREGAEDRWK